MTEQEAIEKIRAEHATYMREWRKRNPEKVKAYRAKSKQRKIQRYMNKEDKSDE